MRVLFSICFSALAIAILFAETSVATSRYFPIPIQSDEFALEQPNARAEGSEVSLNYRLPNETYPEHYDIKLTTNVHLGERAFEGEVIIDIVVVKNTTRIVLHTRQLVISKVLITNPSAGNSEELSYEYEEEREFLTLIRKEEKPFDAETKWKLTITYSGKLRNDNGGFYISTYTDNEGKDRYLATTQFESTDARHAFPCYDEPNKRANFTITINHSPSYTAISNMPVNNALSSGGKTVFLMTPPMPTYIVAFIVSDFEYTGGDLNNLTQHIYSRSSAKHGHEWALMSAMLITARLSTYYGVDFMLPKLDHVAVPDFSAGGMENFGLVTYREEYLLYDKDNSTVYTQTSIANILAHEITHQWFGDYVAIEWWTYLWLKEGFATLFSYKALDDTYPEWGVWQQFHVSDYQKALKMDSGNFARPMTHYVQKPKEISSLYDAVSYSKAGSFLHMWNNALTDKVFQQGLHNYLTNNQYSAAVEGQLFTAIQNAAKELNYKLPATISEIMSSWTHQSGYPLLTVTRDYKNYTFTVKQESFYNNETIKDSKSWFVPINYAVASNPDFHDTEATHYLLNEKDMTIRTNMAGQEWLILNIQSAYYYRIKYDEENYNLIVESLIRRPFQIHARNRAQLMDDAFRLSISNRLDHAILLKMLTYLKKEDQYAPWYTANDIINTLDLYLKGDDKYDDFKLFVGEQVEPTFERLGIEDVPGEQHYQKYIRSLMINMACWAGVESCLRKTNYKLQDVVEKNAIIEPNVQADVYCNGLRNSKDREFDFVYQKVMDSTDQVLRSQLLSSLGCSQNEEQIKKFIRSSIDKTNKLSTQERPTLLRRAYSRGNVSLLACIEFLNENWKDYGNLNGGSNSKPLDLDIRNMASFVTNKSQEEKLLALVELVKNSEHVTKTLEESVKTSISKNFEWLKHNGDPIMSWIAQYHADKRGGSSSAGLTKSATLISLAFLMAFVLTFF